MEEHSEYMERAGESDTVMTVAVWRGNIGVRGRESVSVSRVAVMCKGHV